MTIALEHPAAASEQSLTMPATMTLLGAAGLASMGAGAIHAAAIGAHAEHRSAVLIFAATAAVQLAWGAVALVRNSRVVRAVGALVGAAAIAGWAVAKTTGIGAIAGLDEAEPMQAADTLAAGFAVLSVLMIFAALWPSRSGAPLGVRAPAAVLAVGVGALALYGMVASTTHAGADGTHGVAAGPAGHGSTEVAAGGADPGGATTPIAGAAGEDEEHGAPEPVPYDPTKPIDLSGTPGVTPEQQAAAENLIAVTLDGLQQWEDAAAAEAAGFRSIGDGSTGTEHFVNQANMDDDSFLDPDVPESLVYDTTQGGRRLMAAMYMMERGLPLEDVPNIGGALMQWHTHENLCYTPEGLVRGLTDGDGNCPSGLSKPVPTPMIHVWTQPHPCGPFAALEGIGGGRILEGETKLCDVAHGADS